jgi:uncharacterized membrane protein YfcA
VIEGLLLLAGGTGTGFFGSLLGLGGGILLVPLLTFGFERPLREAVAVSLVSVVVTSSAAASTYLRSGMVNLRLGLVLTLFAVMGTVVGGLVAFAIPDRLLAGMFAILLPYIAFTMARTGTRPRAERSAVAPPASPSSAAMNGSPTGEAMSAADARAGTFADFLAGPDYAVRRLVPASAASIGTGVVAVLLGIGGGMINVPTMHVLMGVPLRVATATSNHMIGVTAVSGAIIYFMHGQLDPYLAGPTLLGVFVGASIGSRSAHRIDLRVVRLLFVFVLGWTAFQMARRAMGI